jgi:FkbM family methyltransferase
MIQRVTRIIRRLSRGKPVASVPLELIHAAPLGVPVIFCVNMERDPIQRKHRNGEFYEQEELNMLKALFPVDGIFVDIGSNIGNHTIFAAQHLGASKVIPFEPNPLAYELLIQNVLVNRLRDVVSFDFIGYGASDEAAGGFGMQKRNRNLGAAKMREGEGDVEVLRADEALAEIEPDFIKIDVEGMEMKALRGLSGVMDRCRPILMVEVDQENYAAFDDWVDAQDYRELVVHQRYATNKNFIICHSSEEARLKAMLDEAKVEGNVR